MSDFDKLLPKDREIPFEKAASFFVAIKEATKVAEGPNLDEERLKGIVSGVRSSAASDITHARRIGRSRGATFGKELGTGSGLLAGLAATRGKGVKEKALGAAIGGLLGRGLGKAVGEEVDLARIRKTYGPKKDQEVEKQSRVFGATPPRYLGKRESHTARRSKATGSSFERSQRKIRLRTVRDSLRELSSVA